MVSVFIVTSLILAGASRASDQAHRAIVEKADGLFEQTGTPGTLHRLSDTAHYEKIDRKNDRLYVLQHWDDTKAWLTVLTCDKSGLLSATRTIADKRLSEITAIESVELLPDGRLFIQCHINPILCLGIAIEIEHGEPLFLRGDGFTWPDSGRHVAYFVDCSRNVQPGTPGATFQIWIDGKMVREVSADKFSSLSWNESGTRLTINCLADGKAEGPMFVTVPDDHSVATAN